LSDLAYPIGTFAWGGPAGAADRARRIDEIAAAPAALRAAVAGLTDAQLDTPYRPGGWTVRQVVHHVPDSHVNAYARFKLAVTEDVPAIKPYREAAWAELADVRTVPVATSLALLDALHERWVVFLRSLGEAEWARTFRHPDLGVVPLEKNLALYAWHGRHHVAHVTALRERMGW
jgi:hypothetical protein